MTQPYKEYLGVIFSHLELAKAREISIYVSFDWRDLYEPSISNLEGG